MKKYFLTVATLLLFAIGFTASDEKEDIAEDGYEEGYNDGFQQIGSPGDITSLARISYSMFHGGAPQSSEDKELFNIYLNNYKKGFSDGYKNKGN